MKNVNVKTDVDRLEAQLRDVRILSCDGPDNYKIMVKDDSGNWVTLGGVQRLVLTMDVTKSPVASIEVEKIVL